MDRQRNLKSARVAIYARFSSERQRETSIDDQVRRCREYLGQAGADPSQATVFSDFAISGASLDRPGFEALMSAVQTKRIDAIVTEDISRISRDFADSALVFKQLQFAQVPLIGIADGIDTSSRDAKLSFTLKSLVADIYLDDLRDKTLRGLEGRAHAGYATGSTPYGYHSVPETTPSGEIRGHRIVIDKAQADVVRRIFSMYRDGHSQPAIAKALNAEGLPSPRAGTRHKQFGWGASTIRAILYNERYRGVWKFKEKQWVKVPGTNKRRPRERDQSEVMSFERPHLRIIDELLWEEVQIRLQAVHRQYTQDGQGQRKGRARSPNSTPYLLSSLLYCGLCDAPMTIVAGSASAYYRCADERKKGTCTNKRSIREDVVRTGILSHLRAMFMNQGTLTYVRQEVARQLGDVERRIDSEIKERRRRLTRVEGRIKGLVEFIADGDRSEYIVTTLQDLEAQARDEKATIARLQSMTSAPVRLPSIGEITSAVLDLNTSLQRDVTEGREQLRRLFKDGRIRMTPTPEGYQARSEVLPLVILAKSLPKTKKRGITNDSALFGYGSGGRI